MPLRLFSRGSPKAPPVTSSGNSSSDMPGKESAARPPLCPLQDASWNSSSGDARNDSLATPHSLVKWWSSAPLPDPFPESQENLASTSPEKPPSSLHSNFRVKPGTKERSLAATSGSLQDTVPRNFHSEQKNSSTTTYASNSEIDNGAVTDVPVARALKYGHSNGALVTASPVTAMSTCGQSHFEIEEDPNFWKEHNVQVVIRLRPLSSAEISIQGQSLCVRQDSAHAITWTGHPESRFAFDIVACETITQEKIFKVAGKPMVDNCLLGYNSCMFAYGQTGSGKTFTMLGDLEGADHQPSDKRGMTPRVFEYLFARITEEEEAQKTERIRFTCKCSFLEIYNEQILDLLDPTATNLQLREDARKGVYVENLSEVEVKDVHDVIRLLLQGAANRKVAATNMNRESSRSHSVFTCIIESKWTSQTITSGRYGRLNLVDLAGSERQKSSGAEGERLKEAANINKSLSTLGLVIMSLVDIANGKQRHVPYRDSKLTFLLHDSLGGNSKTTIIANISPSNCCALETLSTLKFAQRAKFIRNNAIVNENASGDVMALRMQIHQLKQEINRLRLLHVGSGGVGHLPEGMMITDGEHISTPHSAYSLEAWDSFRAFSSPTFSSKNKSGLEIALIGSLRREQVGEARIRQLQNEIEHFKRLVKQREEDSQCGKMMLRFREDKIKRLESTLAGSITSDTYLLEERNSQLEEVQILRSRLERNPEVTRFAMENIRLLEDLRRFQDFYEGSERDVMYEEISVLRDQLYEALDWKLMHEQNLASKAQDVLHKGENADEVDSSTLEKQIETVGAVASMQAELIAMREALVAATNSEMEAREQVSILSEKIESLQRGLNDLQEKNAMYERALADRVSDFGETRITNGAETGCTVVVNHTDLLENEPFSRLRGEIEDLQIKLASLEEENATLHEMHRNALATIEELKKAAQADTETKSEDAIDKDAEIVSLKQEIGDLKRRFEELRKETAAISITQESAVAGRSAITENSSQDTDTLEEIDVTVVTEIESEDQKDVSLMMQEIECLKGELIVLKDRNAHLHGLQLNNLAIIEELKKTADMAQEEYAEEILELQCALHLSQSVLEDLKNDCQISAAKASELISLQNRVNALQEENNRQVSSYEASKEESEARINDLRILLEVVQLTLKCTVDQQDEICRRQDVASSFLSGWIENLEKKFGGLSLKVDKIDGDLGYLLQDADELIASVEKLSAEFLTVFDGSAVENEMLAKELESIKLKLVDAEQARDDVCILSSIEKASWNEEKKILQEKLNNAATLLNAREEPRRDSVRELQSKLDSVEAKLSEVYSIIDKRCDSEGAKTTLVQTFAEILRIEAEMNLVGERQDLAKLKLSQENNKLTALRRVLNGFSSSKSDWSSREEIAQNHVDVLSGILAEKESQISRLQVEEENARNSLDQLLKEQEIMLLETETLKEKLKTTEQWKMDGENSGAAQTSFSMLQLLREEEEKATLLSVIADQQEKLKSVKKEVELLVTHVEKTETALLCVQVEWEAATSSLREAQTELEETKKENRQLIEADLAVRKEYEDLIAACSKAEAEVRGLDEEYDRARQELQELRNRFLCEVGIASAGKVAEVEDFQGDKVVLADMLSDHKRLLLDIRSVVENFSKSRT